MSVSHPHGSSKIQSKSWRLTLPWATLALTSPSSNSPFRLCCASSASLCSTPNYTWNSSSCSQELQATRLYWRLLFSLKFNSPSYSSFPCSDTQTNRHTDTQTPTRAQESHPPSRILCSRAPFSENLIPFIFLCKAAVVSPTLLLPPLYAQDWSPIYSG